jgi:hypothetical protein
MTPEQRAAMQQALEAQMGLVEWNKKRKFIVPYRVRDPIFDSIIALNKELAKPAQGWMPIESAPKRDDVQILTFHADFLPKDGIKHHSGLKNSACL